jgi:hypothetical protein
MNPFSLMDGGLLPGPTYDDRLDGLGDGEHQ